MSSKVVAPEQVPTQLAVGPDLDRDITLVLAFLNTCDVEHGTDKLDDPAHWRQWCAEHGLGTAPDTESVREIRDAMRAAVAFRATPDAAVSPAWPIRVTLRQGVPTLTGIDALGWVLGAALHLVHTGHWDRIKICSADACRWAFYDRSRNRSRTWCSMRVCGNREKARSWRERHAS